MTPPRHRRRASLQLPEQRNELQLTEKLQASYSLPDCPASSSPMFLPSRAAIAARDFVKHAARTDELPVFSSKRAATAARSSFSLGFSSMRAATAAHPSDSSPFNWAGSSHGQAAYFLS
ncbi:hypothetical protein Pfo_024621 [Paulownia fortunei]|nr:hypothetical protein Pfo_024621 [Paulownia fortunei]